MSGVWVYLDTSCALAQLLAEDRRPAAALWERPLIASRLLVYELWTRIHGRGLTESHGPAVRDLLSRVSLLELTPEVLARAEDPFPEALRTLDALHLASLVFLRAAGLEAALASFDRRQIAAARALGLDVFAL